VDNVVDIVVDIVDESSMDMTESQDITYILSSGDNIPPT